MKKAVTAILVLCIITSVAFPVSAGLSLDTERLSRRVTYTDISDHRAKDAVERWTGYGLTHGSEGRNFRPDDPILRSELAAFIVSLVGYTTAAKSSSKPKDVSSRDPYYNDIMKLIAANVIQGAGGYVRPKEAATREEAVTMIARAFKISDRLEGRMTYWDRSQISSWSKGYVQNMRDAGYLALFGPILFPDAEITRAEVLMIFDAMFPAYYAKAGYYSGVIEGNAIIRTENVILKDATIKGDLYIVEGVGTGYYTIGQNTTIEGTIHARAGKENPFPHIDPSARMVALTFDDGPTETTKKILDVLEKYDARATFCIVGANIETHKKTIARAVDLGCELVSHTWNHSALTTMSTDNLKKDTERVSDALYKISGVKPVFVRPPGGSYNSTTSKTIGSMGMATLFWSIDPQDWSHLNSNTTYTRVMDNVKDGSIVLLHDLVISTGTAVEKLVPDLIKKGYQLVTVSELLTYSDVGIKPGLVYMSKFEYK